MILKHSIQSKKGGGERWEGRGRRGGRGGEREKEEEEEEGGEERRMGKENLKKQS